MFGKKAFRSKGVIDLNKLAKKYPFVFVGIPFIFSTVGGSFLLLPMQKTRYELGDTTIKAEKENVPTQNRVKKRLNMQEEYFRLQQEGEWDDYDIKRVARKPEHEPVFSTK
ncbi:Cytochrome c oxidase assembly protein COX16, mitochondrial [Smittium mucronatum]|uniref:Cytochrome c oxidase assembly protein COX16, mitochondrial n=1 Tax=Smittium mucronatum TaxID=133383 RepID=A0A1R0H468_9FUNG|nr:Cytochrome c oxidase assembly protein COX16, mitochondrial [Smittium mucronatum]